ncbi:MAG: hypothetical protein P4L49_18255 [Desulfosporosinus sp.]|nr:hypothetical protein [Desulfosporosinus sp.]
MRISDITISKMKEIVGPIELQLSQMRTYEEASQFFCQSLYNMFPNAIVLARIFVSVPYEKLPESNKKVVQDIIRNTKKQADLRSDTKILSLVGTYGEKNEWNSRLLSKGHVGIPLISKSFIAGIPMMNRLLERLGIDYENETSDNRNTRKSSFSGLFYVKNSENEVDSLGRHIITNQEFVRNYQVKSVFGFGGSYINQTDFYTAIVFLKEQVNLGSAETIALVGGNFKMATKELMKVGQIFVDKNM